MPIGFTMLLNLASASNASDKDVLWGFIVRHVKGVTPQSHPKLDELVGYAVRYYHDFVAPTKVFRAPDDVEREALVALDAKLATLAADAEAEAIQHAVLDVARAIPRYQDPGAQGPRRRAGRVGGVVLDALPDPARPGARAALRLVRVDLRHSRRRGR